jgi:hypothetical protein
VRNRSKIAKGLGSRVAGIAMAYKLIEAAQSRWRAVNAPHLVALVRAGKVRERQTRRTPRRTYQGGRRVKILIHRDDNCSALLLTQREVLAWLV